MKIIFKLDRGLKNLEAKILTLIINFLDPEIMDIYWKKNI